MDYTYINISQVNSHNIENCYNSLKKTNFFKTILLARRQCTFYEHCYPFTRDTLPCSVHYSFTLKGMIWHSLNAMSGVGDDKYN